MRSVMPALAMVTLAGGPAMADDLVWYLYNSEDGGGSLMVLERAEIDSPEPNWRLMLQCIPGEPWAMTVPGVDPKVLGAAIAAGESVTFGFSLDGTKSEGVLGSFFPDLSFGQMTGEWEYVAPLDLEMLREMAAASSLAISGTGIDIALPSEGFFEGVEGLRQRCAAIDEKP